MHGARMKNNIIRTDVKYTMYKALPMRASAPVGRALCSFLQSTSSTEVESYRCVIQLANCATMQCADLWCGGKLLIL